MKRRIFMGMSISFGLSLNSVGSNEAVGSPPAGSNFFATVNELARDFLVFDSGAAIGANAADISLSGTTDAPDGTVIQIRAVRADTGSQVEDWQSVAMAMGGVWSGAMSVGTTPHWLRPEVRVAGSSAPTATTTNRFAAGHVIALWGQSENEKFYGEPPATPAVPLDDEEALQVVYSNRPDALSDTVVDIQHVLVDETVTNNTLIEMANVLNAERPGEKFVLVMQTKGGTGWGAVHEDDLVDRNYSTDKAIHDFATVNGTTGVGTLISSWFNSNRGAGLLFDEYFAPVMCGLTVNGDAVSGGDTVTFSNGATASYDHTLTDDLYDLSRTKWVSVGPHRFDPLAGDDMLSGRFTADSFPLNMRSYEQCRVSWREMAVNPNLPFVGGVGPDLFFMQNGEGDAVAWNDTTHPAMDNPDGLQMLAKQMIHGALRGSGLTDWDVPVFDQYAVAPDGSYVDWWSSAGDITTARVARGLGALDASTQTVPEDFAHWTEVMGIEINDRWAENTQIVDATGNPATSGRVRVYPNEGGVFRAADRIDFGRGGGHAIKFEITDNLNKTYLNLPIVDHGLAYVDGVVVSALPQAPILYPAIADVSVPAVMHDLVSNGSSAFSGGGIPAGTTQVTVETLIRLPDEGGQQAGFVALHDAYGDTWSLEIQGTTQNARIRIRDGSGAYLVNNVSCQPGTIPFGRWITLRMAFDTAAGWVKLFCDDVAIIDAAMTAGVALNSVRFPRFGNGDIAFGHYKLWYAAQADGGTGSLGTPYASIEGDAAAISGHSWRTVNGTITSTQIYSQSNFVINAPVSITGTAEVDQTVTAVPASATPNDGARSYQWRRDGVDISGATGVSYGVNAADEGADLTVMETMIKGGYAETETTSAPVSVPAGEGSVSIDMTGEAAGRAAFQGPGIPASASQLTIETEIQLPEYTSFVNALVGTGSSWIIGFRPSSGDIRLTLRDGAGAILLSNQVTSAGAFGSGSFFVMRFVADLVAQVARVYVDDALIGDFSYAAGSGTFSPVRVPQVVTSGLNLDLRRYRQWYSAEPDFSVPTTTPDIDISGDAASMQASSWRSAYGTVS